MRRRTFLWLPAPFALAHCSNSRPTLSPLPPQSSVLALGDSLTSGVGTSPEFSYPTLLSNATGWNVYNAGIPGNTASQALARLPSLLYEHRPQLVLLGIGGNDMLQRLDLQRTQTIIEQTIRNIQRVGADTVLIGIPNPSPLAAAAGQLKDHPMYAETASLCRIPLFKQGWSPVLSNALWRSDVAHPNTLGYRMFTQALLAFLKNAGSIKA